MDIDFKKLGDEAATLLKDALKELIEGGIDSVEQFVQDITQDFISVMEIENEQTRNAARAELVGQLKAIAEGYRLKAVNQAWDKVARMANIVFQALITGARAAL